MAIEFYTKKSAVEEIVAEKGCKGEIKTVHVKAKLPELKQNPSLQKMLTADVKIYVFIGEDISDSMEFYGESACKEKMDNELTTSQQDACRSTLIPALRKKLNAVLRSVQVTEDMFEEDENEE